MQRKKSHGEFLFLFFQADVWGVAYELCGEDAIAYLNNREVTLGGYVTRLAKFYPSKGGYPFPVLLYIATPGSAYWMGQAPEYEIAEQVVECWGACGHNVEYILRLVIGISGTSQHDFYHNYDTLNIVYQGHTSINRKHMWLKN